MAALIRIYYLWLSATERSFEATHNERFFQAVTDFIINDLTAVPINDDKQVHEPFLKWQIGYVDTPDMIDVINIEIA
jgi:hypothetical protein